MKSHPVSSRCGHSYCYVCIRIWLQKKWTCPVCIKVIREAPFRHYGEEDSIESDYPAWRDSSRVAYRWDGLVFPVAPKVVIMPDSP
ncbi:hypothetical protein B0H17DRAFT_1078874 [Mycena rosella]|uniref:RING-type domain-containing protein n=1 Tax=Mycena rosella TaxID=1033263 RepID=A0AAD7GB72_MYCRO|nr:hypothetical protein B0H17DRAFT_1078874 [Mycena rosella]